MPYLEWTALRLDGGMARGESLARCYRAADVPSRIFMIENYH